MVEAYSGVVPQPVLSPLTTAAIFLVMTIDPGGESVTRELLADLQVCSGQLVSGYRKAG